MLCSGNNSAQVTSCILSKNDIGIFLCLSNQAFVNKCSIRKNKVGISVLNADNEILDNEISFNEADGVKVMSDENMFTKPVI